MFSNVCLISIYLLRHFLIKRSTRCWAKVFWLEFLDNLTTHVLANVHAKDIVWSAFWGRKRSQDMEASLLLRKSWIRGFLHCSLLLNFCSENSREEWDSCIGGGGLPKGRHNPPSKKSIRYQNRLTSELKKILQNNENPWPNVEGVTHYFK